MVTSKDPWDSIKEYDDICVPENRQASLDVILHATHKCEFLKTKGNHFRFCTLDSPDEDEPVSHSSRLIPCMRSPELLGIYCYNEQKCPEYKDKIARIIQQDETMLEQACKEAGVKYIKPSERVSDPKQKSFDTYCQIRGRNYPVKEFDDRETKKQMPYLIKHGKELPIICASAVVVRSETSESPSYLLMQEAKAGSGSKRKDEGKLDIPGGGLEWGESFEACARREFYEEIGSWPEITGAVCLTERINKNNRLIWKAVYTGTISKKARQEVREDSKGSIFLEAHAIRTLCTLGLIKTHDILLMINRIERGIMLGKDEVGDKPNILHIGWD
jgi:ADP-ribose pyrophosphatase YjhB (NUDIX family)